MPFQLALITGASSGIGSELCRLLADKGINLIISGRNLEKLNEIAEELNKKVDVQIVQADLSNADQRLPLIEIIRQTAPDLVINNAGVGYYGYALSEPTEKQLDIVRIDIEAVVEITLEAARALKAKGKKGVILNVSSAASFYVFPCFTVYSAAKTFVNQFSQSFDLEVESDGIRVLAACPGMVATNFRQRAGGSSWQQEKEPGVMNRDYAAKAIWKQIENLKPLNVFDWRYKLSRFISYFIPKRFLAKRLQKNILKRVVSSQ